MEVKVFCERIIHFKNVTVKSIFELNIMSIPTKITLRYYSFDSFLL